MLRAWIPFEYIVNVFVVLIVGFGRIWNLVFKRLVVSRVHTIKGLFHRIWYKRLDFDTSAWFWFSTKNRVIFSRKIEAWFRYRDLDFIHTPWFEYKVSFPSKIQATTMIFKNQVPCSSKILDQNGHNTTYSRTPSFARLMLWAWIPFEYTPKAL